MQTLRRHGAYLLLMLAASATGLRAGPWQPLSNGRDLTGWHPLGGKASFTVENGVIVGTTAAGKENSFLVTDGSYGDFILELEVKQEGGPSNSGVQFRSESTAAYKDGRVHGYQCEIDPSDRAWTGGIYDEARRGWLYPVAPGTVPAGLYRPGEWNLIRIEAIGPDLRTWVNGVPVAHVIDDLTSRGFIALQVHAVSGDAIGRRDLFRNLRIQTADLHPSPRADLPIRNLIPNNVSAEEQAAGWRLLWDGQTTQGWHGARKSGFPAKGWKIEHGEFIVEEGGGGESHNGGDIVTDEKFAAFDLQFDFKYAPGANSGVKYFVEEKINPLGGSAIGLEYQIIDDPTDKEIQEGHFNRSMASLYDLIARGPLPSGPAIKPEPNVWQHARIVVHPDNHVEHWLNGVKVVDYVRGSPAFLAAVAVSKYRDIPGFGLAPQGLILLQDHGNEVHFRSIKIRLLGQPATP